VPTHVLRTPQMEIGVERGIVNLLVNRIAGETFSVSEAPPLTGVRHLKSGEVWSNRPQLEHRQYEQDLLIELRWREQGTGNVLQTRLRAQPEGDVLVTQKADCTLPGLVGLQWGLVIPDSCELLVPGYSGLRLSADSDFQPMQFNYPMEWEAQFVLIQGKRGGFLIYAEDNAEHFKRLFVQHRRRQFWVGFETWCTAPFDKIQQAESVRWRICAYSGSWLHGAAMYRRWAEETFGLAALRRTQPGWVDDIQTVIIDNGDDMDKMRPLAERLNPRQTLLYIPDWRRDGYDRNYPDYTPREDFPQRMEQARRLGFRIMLHVNYFGCTPENPVYEQMKPYHFRDPLSGNLLYWDWQRADPPIKFAYINPAAKAWRELFVKRMVELCRLLKPDALHLDQTLCIYNDRNGLIDGMNAMQGNMALHRELRDALPDVALSGEGLNEVSFRYEQFAQRHAWGINAADSKADMRYVRMAHPVSSSLLVPHTRLYGYLGMVSPQMWQLYVAWRTAYERFGVLPTFGWLSREQATQPDTTMQIFWGEARWFQQHRPVPDYTPARWDAHTLFAYRTADGGTARYRREPTGVCLEAQKGGMRRIVARRIEGVSQARVGGSIPHWHAYNEQGMLGLNPDTSYVWVSNPPDLNALHVHHLPDKLMVAAATVQQAEWAHFGFQPREEVVAVLHDLGESIRYAVAGKVGEGYIVEHETGAVARPYGDGIFMHPPYRRHVGKGCLAGVYGHSTRRPHLCVPKWDRLHFAGCRPTQRWHHIHGNRLWRARIPVGEAACHRQHPAGTHVEPGCASRTAHPPATGGIPRSQRFPRFRLGILDAPARGGPADATDASGGLLSPTTASGVPERRGGALAVGGVAALPLRAACRRRRAGLRLCRTQIAVYSCRPDTGHVPERAGTAGRSSRTDRVPAGGCGHRRLFRCCQTRLLRPSSTQRQVVCRLPVEATFATSGLARLCRHPRRRTGQIQRRALQRGGKRQGGVEPNRASWRGVDTV
jgi:hypothetical protein